MKGPAPGFFTLLGLELALALLFGKIGWFRPLFRANRLGQCHVQIGSEIRDPGKKSRTGGWIDAARGR